MKSEQKAPVEVSNFNCDEEVSFTFNFWKGMIVVEIFMEWHNFLFPQVPQDTINFGIGGNSADGAQHVVFSARELWTPLGCFLPLVSKEKYGRKTLSSWVPY